MSYKRIILILAFFVASTVNMESIKADSCVTDAMQKEADQLQIYSTFNESTKTYDVTVEGLTSGNVFVYLTDGTSEYQFIKKPDWLDDEELEEDRNQLETVDENENVIQTIYYEDNKAIIRNIASEKYTAVVRPSTSTGCSETIRSEKLSLQSYNVYADDPRCADVNIEEFPMCDPWYEGTISEETFTKNYNDYQAQKAEENKPPEEEPQEEEPTIGDQIFEFLSNYYIHIIVGVIIIVIVGTIIQALVRKRKKPGDLL